MLLVACSTDRGGGADDEQSSPCGMTLTTSGGTFDPQTCELQLIIPGPACNPGPCDTEKTVALRDTAAGHINDVSLFHLVRAEVGTYRADLANGVTDFNGQIIDAASRAQNLIEGEIAIDSIDSNRVTLTVDALFTSNIHVQATGTIPVVNVAAP